MRRFLRVAVVACAFLGAPASALALGLDLLVGGGSITSGNGLLTFDDFSVIATGSVSDDLSLYDIRALTDGLAITGPISAADGESGDLFVSFRVTSSQPLSAVILSFNGAARGSGSSASVTETADDVDDDTAFVFATGGGGLDLVDELLLTGAQTVRLAKDILVRSAGAGAIAVISRIEQRFQVELPEPFALVLLATGLAGIAIRRRLA
jgi:hypothetical protein